MYVPKFKVHSGQFFEKMTYFAIFLNIAQCSILWEISDLTILHKDHLSGGFWVRQAQRKVVKIFCFDFFYWASSTPWGHVLSLKTFCRNPVLSWAIRYSVFQKVKFTSSLQLWDGNCMYYCIYCHFYCISRYFGLNYPIRICKII